MTPSPLSEHDRRAIADWRRDHPDADHIPDEEIVKLLIVAMASLWYALADLGRTMLDALAEGWWWLFAAVWVVVLLAALIAWSVRP